MLAERPLHPTMWIRMWFADGEKQHQRGYTLVNPDPESDTVDIEFALHDGIGRLRHRRRHGFAAGDQLAARSDR
jgi:NADPH-dependent ferric siderophore reductase